MEKSRQTVEEFLTYWLEHVHKSTLEATSYMNYRYALDSRLLPYFGHIQIQKLTTHQIQMFCSKLLHEEGLGAGYVRQLLALLHSALDHAVKENVIARNACDGVRLPRYKKRDQRVFTPDEARKLLLSVQKNEMRTLILLAIVTGLRRDELLGPKWSDIDFKSSSMHIKRSLAYVVRKGLIEKSPKSEHSKREISLPLFVVDALKTHRALQQEVRLAAGDIWQERDLVFCNKDGAHISPFTLDHRFKRLLEQAQLPTEMRLHDLRHSAVTILLQMGVPPHVVQEIAGHSNINTTLGIYGHVLPGQQKSAMDKWHGVLGDQSQDRYATLRQQWMGYSSEIQEQLEEILQHYGDGAVQMATRLIGLWIEQHPNRNGE